MSLLAADCDRCAALCCLALDLDKGDRFAIDKPAGAPCPNLSGMRCRIHGQLTSKGFGGCVAYDCAGAGQRVTQDLFAGKTWRENPALTAPMMESFRHMRAIHDTLAMLQTAAALPLSDQDHQRLTTFRNRLSRPLDRTQAAEEAGRLGDIQSFFQSLATSLGDPKAVSEHLRPPVARSTS